MINEEKINNAISWVLDNSFFVIILVALIIIIIILIANTIKHSPKKNNQPLPYHIREDFLSEVEFELYTILRHYLGSDIMICPKVNLNDIFFTTSTGSEKSSFVNKINRKHVDFLLCDADTMTPICGVELDDSSHQREDRIARDIFVDSVYESANLPLIHIPLEHGYTKEDIECAFEEVIDFFDIVDEFEYQENEYYTKSGSSPLCPKCNSEMLMKVHYKGANKGGKYYKCSNYPKCKATVEVK